MSIINTQKRFCFLLFPFQFKNFLPLLTYRCYYFSPPFIRSVSTERDQEDGLSYLKLYFETPSSCLELKNFESSDL